MNVFNFIDAHEGCGKMFTASTIANAVGLHDMHSVTLTELVVIKLTNAKTAHSYNE